MQCYAVERPYTDIVEKYHASQDNIFLPTVLADITQIIAYCQKQMPLLDSLITETDQIKIHTYLRDLCYKNKIIGSESESLWDSYIDQQIESLPELINANNVSFNSKFIPLVYEQLSSSIDVIKRAVFQENDVYNEQQHVFWRFSQQGSKSDITYCQSTKNQVSFGDSLLSGYIKDGVWNSDIREGINNYGACVFNYYDLHRQGIKIQDDGYMNAVSPNTQQILVTDLPQSYQNYLSTLKNHELYMLKYNEEDLALLALEKENPVYIPLSTISSAACFQSGEDFHPRVLLGDSDYDRIDLLDV